MQFQIPQFIEVEDKIFGPLTFKQFAYLTGAGGMAVIFYLTMPKWLAFPLMLPFIALGLALAFWKINKKPFVYVLESAFYYLIRHKLYLWKKEEKKIVGADKEATTPMKSYVPKLSDSRLRDLTWSLDIKANLSHGVSETMQK